MRSESPHQRPTVRVPPRHPRDSRFDDRRTTRIGPFRRASYSWELVLDK